MNLTRFGGRHGVCEWRGRAERIGVWHQGVGAVEERGADRVGDMGGKARCMRSAPDGQKFRTFDNAHGKKKVATEEKNSESGKENKNAQDTTQANKKEAEIKANKEMKSEKKKWIQNTWLPPFRRKGRRFWADISPSRPLFMGGACVRGVPPEMGLEAHALKRAESLRGSGIEV
ncbi:hypothetical protein FNV43_RR06288 [Rhamnella rubrinervis]|uniref:Uncharacterized protein n=1 Tax=Rhamnella rubrinervis TaxID=2594499 RepID=A0A8K0HEA6_9ROSA|nr:hypothetical protein FNV43_RR06288 [Rhamnella rubrinervis]